jgi:hypothetical protein
MTLGARVGGMRFGARNEAQDLSRWCLHAETDSRCDRDHNSALTTDGNTAKLTYSCLAPGGVCSHSDSEPYPAGRFGGIRGHFGGQPMRSNFVARPVDLACLNNAAYGQRMLSILLGKFATPAEAQADVSAGLNSAIESVLRSAGGLRRRP